MFLALVFRSSYGQMKLAVQRNKKQHKPAPPVGDSHAEDSAGLTIASTGERYN